MTPTKRNLLKLSASLFDPLGIFSPVSVRIKILLQETCKLHLEWDMLLPETLVKMWSEIRFHAAILTKLVKKIEQYSLHAFGNSSKKAICSMIYPVVKNW